MFVVGVASYTNIAAPIEYMLELQRRGHRITWQQPRHLLNWFGSEEERQALPFNFSLVDVGTDVLRDMEAGLQLLTERPWMEVFDRIATLTYQSPYPTLYRALMAAIETEKPDLVVCDSLRTTVSTSPPSCIWHQWPLTARRSWTTSLHSAMWTHPSTTTYSHNWHEQPLWHRLYNTYAILPQLLWYGVVSALRGVDAMKEAIGAPESLCNRYCDASWA